MPAIALFGTAQSRRHLFTEACCRRRPPFEPVPERNRRDGRQGNRQEHARDTSQSGASQYGDDHRQRMQGGAAPNEARVNHVVLDDTEDPEKRQRPERQRWRMERADETANVASRT